MRLFGKQLSFLGLLLAVSSLVASQDTPQKEASRAYAQEIARFYDLSPESHLKILPVEGYQQTLDYTCGPAALMSLLHYYGKLSDKDLTRATELKIAAELGTSEEKGTSEQQIIHWLRQHGFQATLGYNGTPALLKKYIAKGIPVLICWIDWGGHWVVVTGFNHVNGALNQNKDLLFLADPAVSDDNIRFIHGLNTFNTHRFEGMWFSSTLVKGIYIIATLNDKKNNV